MTPNQKLYDTALAMDGKQYQTEDCARAVSDVFKAAGLANLLPAVNSNWVPNWADAGIKIIEPHFLAPGDVVIYNWGERPGQPDPAAGGPGYDHIGIVKEAPTKEFGGPVTSNGTAWNVSSAHDHQFVATPITDFQEGRRFQLVPVEPVKPPVAKLYWGHGNLTLIYHGQVVYTVKDTPALGSGVIMLEEV